MSVSGLAITLSDRGEEAEAALRAIERHPSLELGIREGRRVAAAADTATSSDDRALHRWLNELPGVDAVDVVFVHFDESES